MILLGFPSTFALMRIVFANDATFLFGYLFARFRCLKKNFIMGNIVQKKLFDFYSRQVCGIRSIFYC